MPATEKKNFLLPVF